MEERELIENLTFLSGVTSGLMHALNALVESLDEESLERMRRSWASVKAVAETEMLMAPHRDGWDLTHFRRGFDHSIRRLEGTLGGIQG